MGIEDDDENGESDDDYISVDQDAPGNEVDDLEETISTINNGATSVTNLTKKKTLTMGEDMIITVVFFIYVAYKLLGNHVPKYSKLLIGYIR